MHRTAETAVEAGLTGKDLGQSAVEQEVDRQLLYIAAGVHVLFDNVQNGTAEKFLHNVVKLFVIELLDRGKSLRQDLAVAAVRTEGEVVDIQAVRLADSGGLLTEGEVCGAGVIVLNAVVFALDLDLVQHGLKLMDDRHIAVDPHKIILRIELFFFGQRFFVLADRDILEMDKTGFKRFLGVDKLTFRHDIYLLFVILKT